jgi:hypothetical protein
VVVEEDFDPRTYHFGGYCSVYEDEYFIDYSLLDDLP